MGSIRAFTPVKLFAGILAAQAPLIREAETLLSAEYGPVDHRSDVLSFDFTDYYRQETGDSILRVFLAFERLIDAHQLPEVKRRTNALEAGFSSRATGVKRPVNIDPGYLENSKVVLASTKNFYHRIYLGQGIFGEVTLHFKAGAFQFFPWTYPDYQSPGYQKFFLELRRIYRDQLRSMCLLNRPDPDGPEA
jgi:hypothetical protein